MADPKTEFVLAARDATAAAFASVKANLAQLSTAAESVQGAFARFNGLAPLLVGLGGGLALAGIVQDFKSLTAELAALDDAAEKSGASVESLSALLYALKPSGASLEQITGIATRLVRSMQEAGDQTSKSAEAFRALGISARDASGNLRDPADTLQEIAVKLGTFRDGANKTALAQALLGKSGAEALPILKDLAEAGDLQAKVTARQAAEAERFEKELGKLKVASEALKISIVSDLLPALNDLISKFRKSREEGLSLWESLRAAAPGPGSNIQDQIRGEVDALAKLDAERKRVAKSASYNQLVASELAGIDAQIAKRTKYLNVLRKLAQDAALDGASASALDARDARASGPTALGDAPKLTGDADKAGQQIARAREALLQAQTKITLDAEKQLASGRLAILEANYRDGLVGEQSYWSQRQAIQDAAYRSERQALDQQIARQQAAAATEKAKSGTTAEYFATIKELAETQAQRNKLEADYALQRSLGDVERQRAAKAYADSLRDVNTQITELQGNTVGAALARFDAQVESFRNKAISANDGEAIQRLNTLRDLTRAQAEFNAQREKATLVESDLAATEERIQNAQRTGAIGELEALRQTSAARQAAVVQLQQIEVQYRAIAEASGNPALIAAVDTFSAKLGTLKAQADLVREKFLTIGEDITGKFVEDITSGTEQAADAFKNLADNVRKELIKLFVSDIRTLVRGGAGAVDGSGFLGLILRGIGLAAGTDLSNGSDLATSSAFADTASRSQDLLPKSAASAPLQAKSSGGVTIVQHINVDSRSDIASVQAAMRSAKDAAKAEILYSLQTGGQFARSV